MMPDRIVYDGISAEDMAKVEAVLDKYHVASTRNFNSWQLSKDCVGFMISRPRWKASHGAQSIDEVIEFFDQFYAALPKEEGK